jgi:hypothetical protein
MLPASAKYKITAAPAYKNNIDSTIVAPHQQLPAEVHHLQKLRARFWHRYNAMCNMKLRLTRSRSANGALSAVLTWGTWEVPLDAPRACSYLNCFTAKTPTVPVPGPKSSCTATAEAIWSVNYVVATATCCY